MKSTMHLSLASTLAFVLASSALLAQEGGAVAKDARQESQEVRPPVFVKATLGPRAVVTNEAEESLGIVHDHMLDGRTGRIHYVVVGAELPEHGQARLVPYDRFTWSVEEERLLLPMSAAELASLPEYDPQNLPPISASSQLSKGQLSTGQFPKGDLTMRNGPGAQSDLTDGAAQKATGEPKRECIASSGLLGSHVVALNDEVFASVSELVLEPREGKIAFVLAKRATINGDPYILPFPALTWQRPEAEVGPGHFSVVLEKTALKVAPKLERGDTTLLQQQETLHRVYRFYDLPRPLSEVMGISQRG